MKISLITVCRNAVNTIEETLLSVQNQNYPQVEHIVIDGASSDGTVNIIQQHKSSITTYISEPDRGIYDAMNKGIAMASGEIIGTLNADDIYADETVLSQVATIFANPEIDACYADLIYVDPNHPEKIIRYWRSRDYRSGLFEKGWMPAHPTFFVRRKIYEKFGNFDLSFPRQADFELTMRFLAVHEIRSHYEPNVWVRMQTGGISNRNIIGILKGNIEAYQACKKNGLKVNLLFIPRKMISRIPQFLSRPHRGE